MLKKKINGVWENCYQVKKKVNGSWVKVVKSNVLPGLSRYTNHTWITVYYPEISIIGYHFGPTGGDNRVYASSNESFGVTDYYYYSSSTRITKGYFGRFNAVSGDIISGAISYYMTTPDDTTHYVRISIVNFADSTSTNFTSLRTIIETTGATGRDEPFSYTLRSSYSNLGFYIETRASARYSSYWTPSNVYGTVNYFTLNGSFIYIAPETVENQ